MEKINAVVKNRILLADDSVTIQKVVNLTFADEGIEVVAVGDGDAAMQKFVEAVPDLVMVDVNMPGADGYHICEMIKQDDETKHIPVILLVGSFEPFDEAEARRVGADDFLTKPFQSIRQLVNKVTDLLNGKTSGNSEDGRFAGSFDDTLEMVKPIEEPETKNNFGDSTMDDEMIQTNQIGSLPVNEAQKFESVKELEKPAENEDAELETETEIEWKNEDLTEETAPEIELTPEEKQEENQTALEEDLADEKTDDEPMPRHENIYEFANEQEFEDEELDESSAETKEHIIFPPEEIEPEQIDLEANESDEIETNDLNEDEIETEEPKEENSQEITEPEESEPETLIEETAPVESNEDEETPTKLEATQEFALDDFDLLELPQSGKAKPLAAKIADARTSKGNLSPEDIEAIADRVVEKLSRELIEQIVREVTSQISNK